MPPPHLSLSENMNQPTDSPRSASSSTLIITALPTLPGGLASSSLSKLVELDNGGETTNSGGAYEATLPTAGIATTKSPKPNLRLHTMPLNPHALSHPHGHGHGNQNQSQSLDRMSHKGFIEPHRSHLPRRAGRSKGRDGERSKGDDEEKQRPEVVRMQRIESVATEPDFEVQHEAQEEEAKEKETYRDRLESTMTERFMPQAPRTHLHQIQSLPHNAAHISGLPYPLPLMSPGLPHPAMGLTMGLMEAAERKVRERERELQYDQEERTPIPATVGGVRGTPYLGLNTRDTGVEQDEEPRERVATAGRGVGLGLGGVGGLGGLGLGVRIGVSSPPPIIQRRSASQTRISAELGLEGLPPVPQTAPVGGPSYPVRGQAGAGGATRTGPTAFNLPRRHHKRGRDSGKDKERVQSQSRVRDEESPDVVGKAVNTPLPLSPPPLQHLTQPFGPGLMKALRPPLHHREDSMDVRGKQGEGEVRLLRVERVEKAVDVEGESVAGVDAFKNEEEVEEVNVVQATPPVHAPQPANAPHIANERIAHSSDDGSLSIERRMRSPGPAMYRHRQAVVREEPVGPAGMGVDVERRGSPRAVMYEHKEKEKIEGKTPMGMGREMKNKNEDEDKRSLQVLGWTRVEVGFLSDVEERADVKAVGKGLPFVELRVVEPLKAKEEVKAKEEEEEQRTLRLYLPAAKPHGLDGDSVVSIASTTKDPVVERPDEAEALAPSSIPFPVTLTPITPLTTLPPAPAPVVAVPLTKAVQQRTVEPPPSSSLPSSPSPYLDGIPSLTSSQLRAGCAFISRWLGRDSFVDNLDDEVEKNPKNGKQTKEQDEERRWIRILAPRWRPEDALALGLCWAVGVESRRNTIDEQVAMEDEKEVVVKLEVEVEEEEAKASPSSDEEKADVLIESDRSVERVEGDDEKVGEANVEEVEVGQVAVKDDEAAEVKVKEEEAEHVFELPQAIVEAQLNNAPAVLVPPEQEPTQSAARLRTSPHRIIKQHRRNLVVPLGVNDLQAGGFGFVDGEVDIIGIDTAIDPPSLPAAATGPPLASSPPDPSELLETEYTPYHLLAMRLLDDDASWLTRGCVGVGAETSGVVVVPDVDEEVNVDADADADADIVPGGTVAILLNESNKDTVESSLENWKMRGYVSGPEGEGGVGRDADVRKRGRPRMRTRKSHIREAAVGGLSGSEDGKKEKAIGKTRMEKGEDRAEKEKEKPREMLSKWVGLRDEWRGVLSYEGLAMLAKLAGGVEDVDAAVVT